MNLIVLRTKLAVVTPQIVVALTCWGEARGEGRGGMAAVACVIRNRVGHPRWWGQDWIGVCLDPWQFSAWNDDDPNMPQMLKVPGSGDAIYTAALLIARDVTAGVTPDVTGGADSYYDCRMPAPPNWAARAAHTVDIGHHRFFRVELPAPNGQPAAPAVRYQPPPAVGPTADDLNATELGRIQGVPPGGRP